MCARPKANMTAKIRGRYKKKAEVYDNWSLFVSWIFNVMNTPWTKMLKTCTMIGLFLSTSFLNGLSMTKKTIHTTENRIGTIFTKAVSLRATRKIALVQATRITKLI